MVGSMLTGGIALGVFFLNMPEAVSPMGSKPAAENAPAACKTYDATLYVAGMGGHFAKAVAHIDPSAAQPINISSLTKVDIGTRPTHPTHDARIDNNDRNTMFWSTYKIDKEASGVHVGKTDLRTGKIIQDVVVDIPAAATNTKSMYCASGQSKTSFIPMTMTSLGYIDVFNKSDLKRTQRVFLEGTDADTGPYKFYHGNTNNAMTKLLIIKKAPHKPPGKNPAKIELFELDFDPFGQGKDVVFNHGTCRRHAGELNFTVHILPRSVLTAPTG